MSSCSPAATRRSRYANGTAPSFIVQAEDDPVHVENAVVYFLALKNAKVPAELHIYAEGGHGYGLRRTALPVTTWPLSVETWLRSIHILFDSAGPDVPAK
jgi:acetyl esterase/lipase